MNFETKFSAKHFIEGKKIRGIHRKLLQIVAPFKAHIIIIVKIKFYKPYVRERDCN